MKKVLINTNFEDRYTKVLHKAGDTENMTEERVAEIKEVDPKFITVIGNVEPPETDKSASGDTMPEGSESENTVSEDTAPEDTAPEDTAPEDTASEGSASEEPTVVNSAKEDATSAANAPKRAGRKAKDKK